MKIQTANPAERDGTVKGILARPDHVVNARDLLLELELSDRPA